MGAIRGHSGAKFFRKKLPYPLRFTRGWKITLSIVAPVLVVVGILAATHWPYRYRKFHPLLEDVFGTQVKIANFHRVYFPHPGLIATGITLTRRTPPGQSPFGTVETVFIEGRWRDLLTLQHRVRLVEITGMKLVLPAPGSQRSIGSKPSPAAGQLHKNTPQSTQSSGGANDFTGPSTAVEMLRIHNSTLNIARVNGGRYAFAIRDLQITGLQRGKPWNYVVDMENPLPSGHIAARGVFGPIDSKDFGATPVAGDFVFDRVKLSDVGVLHGTLASHGSFRGPLRAIDAHATSQAPDFAVDGGRPTPITGSIQCTVNGLNGDVSMSQVEVDSGKTRVQGRGSIAGSPKTSVLDFAVAHGRAEDVLRPFLRSQAPILGPVAVQGHAWIGPPGQPFLKRMRVTGRFVVPAERVTYTDTEHTLSAFSRRMEKHKQSRPSTDPPDTSSDVLSSLQGPVSIRDGVLSTPDLLFQLPGASATLHGTYTFGDESVHLLGELKMQAGISHAVTGWKSAVLRILSPFFRRKNHEGSKVAIAVVGTPGHYRVTHAD